MAALASVYVEVLPDTRRFGSQLDRSLGSVNTESSGRKAGHHFGSAFSGAAKSIIGGLGASIAALGVGKVLKDSVVGFRAHEKVAAQTAAVLKSTGNAAGTSVSAIGKLSDALERKSTVDGDVIQSGANMLATFTNVQNRVGKGNDIFNRATATVLDMSVALGQDAPSSAIQLGKALNDPVKGITALSRVGVTFTKGQRDQIAAMVKAGNVAGAQKVILAELNKEFGGSAAAQGKAAGAQGRLTVAWRQAQDTIGSALLPLVNQLEGAFADRLPGAADKAGKGITQLGYGITAMLAAFHGEGVTSKGFVGFMEHVGVAALQAKYGVLALIEAYKGGGVTSKGFVGAMEHIGVALAQVRNYLHTVDFHKLSEDAKAFIAAVRGTDVEKFSGQLQSIHAEHLGDAFHVAGAGIGFLADHIDLLVKALPILIAAFAAYKATQAAANVADVVSIPLKAAQVGANLLLARSIKSLAASQVEQTGASVVNTAVTNAGSAALGVSRARTLAATAAQIVAKGATLVWAGAQVVLNAVLTANPIGLVIVGIAALIAIVVVIATKTTWFQTIWRVAWGSIQAAAKAVWDWIKRNWPLILGILTGPIGAAVILIVRNWDRIRATVGALWTDLKAIWQAGVRFVVSVFLGMVSVVLNGAAKAFGWVPGLGGKLKSAAEEFGRFRNRVNTALGGVKDRVVTVSAALTTSTSAVERSGKFATGGAVRGPGSGTSDSVVARLSNGEHVWTAKEVAAAGGHAAMGRLRKAVAAGQVAGFARGGPVGFAVSPKLTGLTKFEAALAAFNSRVDAMARKLAISAGGGRVISFARSQAGKPYVWGASGPGGYDCSGFVSALVNVAQGRSPYSRRFSTGTLPAGLFAPGRGAFNVGWFTGNPGHVAATVNGVPMESRGGDGVVVGSRSRGASYSYFTHHGHLKGFAKGGPVLPGDPPFDLLDPRGKHYRPGLLDALKDAQRGGPTVADSGAWLPPKSTTVVRNGTSQWEPVGPPGGNAEMLAELRALRSLLERLPDGVGRSVGTVMTKSGGRR